MASNPKYSVTVRRKVFEIPQKEFFAVQRSLNETKKKKKTELKQ